MARPARISFNGKPKASALVGNTVAFGLPLNDGQNSLALQNAHRTRKS
jgi:hypothetical protein